MGKNNQTVFIILFIILNLIIWPFFILPNAWKIAGSLLKKSSESNKSIVIERAKTAKEILERIDFYNLRDPFLPRNNLLKNEKMPVKKMEKPLIAVEKPVVSNSIADEKYESRFKLKSIVLLKEKYAAALEEIPHYGNQAENAPYSYRFGDNYDQSSSGPKSYLVIEGDSVLGEQVIRITADFVILQKGKRYFKLTFSGGSPIEWNP